MDTLAIYEWFMENMNYGWITLLMAIESSFIPFPSEIVVPPAAFKAMQPGSGLNIYLVVVFATVGAIIGAIFETLCSVYQEYFLGTVSWDYSGSKYSLMGGRTDLVYAVFWGILAVVWIKLLYPFMSKWIEKIPNKVGVILTWILFVFMVFDCVISCMAVDRMVKRHNGTAESTAVGNFLDDHYPDEFLLTIYPNMIFTDTGEVLHEVAGDDKETENSENTENNTENNMETETAASANSVKVDLFSLYQFDR